MKFHYFGLFFAVVYGWVDVTSGGDYPCVRRDFGRGSFVCVCNSTYCDESSVPKKLKPGLLYLFTSSERGGRFEKSERRFNEENEIDGELGERKKKRENAIDGRTQREGRLFLSEFFNELGDFPRPARTSSFQVRRERTFQKILGFGGAFTDAAGINIRTLSKAAQFHLMKSYFGEGGIEYSMGRVPIGGTDFSTHPYTYDDALTPDLNLTRFALQPEDHQLKIPFIRMAQKLAGSRKIRLVASPWSAPVWMKTNQKLFGAGSLRREFYQSWADYFVRFLKDYDSSGVDIWGVTTGNEPFNGFVVGFPFNCMGWKANDMRNWIANHLGPAIQNYKSEKDVKILIFDDNKGALPTWAKEILGNEDSSKYVSGIGTHWYLDFLTGSEVLSRTHAKFPDVFIVQTEACLGFLPWELEKVSLGNWGRGESYLEAIIRDMKNWVSGWIDWNLALDMKGGPNWARLAADAAIIVNPKKDEFFKQPIYYGFGHVSKFVPADSVRIEMTGVRVPRGLHYIAFQTPNNSTVLIFLNKMSYGAKVSLTDRDRGSIQLTIPAKSMQTILYS